MISFSNLGKYGRFGNQIFQYVFLRSQAQRLGVKYSCPSWIGDKVFNLNETNRIISNDACPIEYVQPGGDGGFDERAFLIQNETDIRGYFQSHHYFSAQAREWFDFKYKYLPVKKNLVTLFGLTQAKVSYEDRFKNAVAIHLRFGDYLDLKHIYVELDVEYYRKSLIEISDIEEVIVFSDNIPLAKQKLVGIKDVDLHYYSGVSEIDDFAAMAHCRQHIISNSTFSWWSAWISNSSHVIMPSNWFSDSYAKKSDDLVCEGWQVI